MVQASRQHVWNAHRPAAASRELQPAAAIGWLLALLPTLSLRIKTVLAIFLSQRLLATLLSFEGRRVHEEEPCMQHSVTPYCILLESCTLEGITVAKHMTNVLQQHPTSGHIGIKA